MMDVEDISRMLGPPQSAIKLLLSVVAGYFLAITHHQLVKKFKPEIQHVFFIVSSSYLYYWNYGNDIGHAYICILIQWCLIATLKGSTLCVSISFLFQMSYLVWGYFAYSSNDYDINWLMPHCVLTLRLIGLAFDVYDGNKDEKYVTKEQQDRKLTDLPSLLEVFGFAFFPAGFLVGPQFPLSRVRSLVNGTLVDKSVESSSRYKAAISQFMIGLVTLAVHSYIARIFNTNFYFTQDFKDLPFYQRAGYVSVTGYITLLQYVTIWMINEGACIIFGIGYQKQGDKHKWNAVQNAKLYDFLFCQSFQGLVKCFNMNTNDWVSRYVYKRLKFLGSRYISQACTLFFLAIWHGVHVGYFTCFAYEFLVFLAEKPFTAMLDGMESIKKMREHPLMSWVLSTIGFVHFHIVAGYALIDFSLLKWNRYLPVYNDVYWFGHLFYISLFVLVKMIPKSRPVTKAE